VSPMIIGVLVAVAAIVVFDVGFCAGAWWSAAVRDRESEPPFERSLPERR